MTEEQTITIQLSLSDSTTLNDMLEKTIPDELDVTVVDESNIAYYEALKRFKIVLQEQLS